MGILQSSIPQDIHRAQKFYSSKNQNKLPTSWVSIKGEQGNLNPSLLYRIQDRL